MQVFLSTFWSCSTWWRWLRQTTQVSRQGHLLRSTADPMPCPKRRAVQGGGSTGRGARQGGRQHRQGVRKGGSIGGGACPGLRQALGRAMFSCERSSDPRPPF